MWKLNQRLLTVVMNSCVGTFDELGLETKEFFVLDEVDTCRYPAVLATKLMIPRASVTIYLRSLVSKGLVRREIDEEDLRRHRLATTQHGRHVLGQALDALAAGFSDIMGRLDQHDRDELRRILLTLLEPEGRSEA
ncbi:MarR family winged helix-turn-helix transcriptional regulator [Streptomyces sp. NPDC050433]|uniref:MarR family winged helix-turn-helix transcriptional regulator n=1 Tax=unclassified Streptomyces TaxID=2593676 RepID=UPI00343750DB